MKHWKSLGRRGLALFLVLMMCVTLLPTAALAAEMKLAGHACNEDGWICEETRTLVCETAGHLHSGECYTAGEQGLTCALDESEGHAHADACYSEETTLICGLEESEEHLHSEGCWRTDRVLTCALDESEGHTHGEDCYAAGEPELICGLEEHEHGEMCYETRWTHIEPDETIKRFLNAVDAIPTEVTTADEAAVAGARDAYAVLTGEEKLNPSVAQALAALETAGEALADARAKEIPALVIPGGAIQVTAAELYEYYGGYDCEDIPAGSLFTAVGGLYGPEDDSAYPQTLYMTGAGVGRTLELADYAALFGAEKEAGELAAETVTITRSQILFNDTPVTLWALLSESGEVEETGSRASTLAATCTCSVENPHRVGEFATADDPLDISKWNTAL